MSQNVIKFLSSLCLPLPIALILLLTGLLAYRKSMFPVLCLSLSATIMLFFSLNITTDWMVHSLEQPFTPVTEVPKDIHHIVVLGGGVRANRTLPPNTQLNASSLSRLIEGIRLYKKIRKKTRNIHLILSGGAVFQSHHEAGILKNTATLLGVSTKDMILEKGSTNTDTEAQYLYQILGDQPFLLVTSATHMKRAMYLFNHYHMHPIAAPTQFIEHNHTHRGSTDWLPKARNMVRADIVLHEYIGLMWAHLRFAARRQAVR